MCVCCSLTCEECDRTLPVHIGDFCTPAENVAVRCQAHPPQSDSGMAWVLFRDVRTRKPVEYGDWWMATRDWLQVAEGYGVGLEGDITPNTEEWQET